MPEHRMFGTHKTKNTIQTQFQLHNLMFVYDDVWFEVESYIWESVVKGN